MRRIFGLGILMILVAVIMVVSTTGVMAATIYLDGAIRAQMDNTHGTWDYNPFYLGADIPLGNWKISAEYSPETNWYQNEKPSGYTIKGGYAFINNDNTRIGLDLGVYSQKFKAPHYYYIYDNDPIIGLDGTFKLADNFNLDLVYDTYFSALSGHAKSGATSLDIDQLTLYKIKFSYLFNDNWGIGFGYRSVVEKADTWNKFTYGAATFGVNYTF